MDEKSSTDAVDVDGKRSLQRKQFTKAQRLLNKKHYAYVQAEPCSVWKGDFLVVVVRKSLDFSRLGIAVSRRYGKAHQRNRFKRLVREVFRIHQSKLISGVDIIVKPRAHCPLPPSYTMIEKELLAACRAS